VMSFSAKQPSVEYVVNYDEWGRLATLHKPKLSRSVASDVRKATRKT
jgi:hypothetical protein